MHWVPVPNFPKYLINQQAEVLNTKGIPLYRSLGGREGYKYPFVRLRRSGVRIHIALHKLVWISFNGPVPEGMQVDHIDRNRNNPCLSNLRLLTIADNLARRSHCLTGWEGDELPEECPF